MKKWFMSNILAIEYFFGSSIIAVCLWSLYGWEIGGIWFGASILKDFWLEVFLRLKR